MAIVALALTLGMPKLMENSMCLIADSERAIISFLTIILAVDPEMRAEFEQQSRASPLTGATTNAMTGGGFDLAGWMAGTSPSPMASAGEARDGATGRETTAGSARKRG